ncbi:MAG: hypothetical protein JWN64_738 [Parcubacteria group bacterium]|nr:hypothetical protein [Parcubacteria group bacterium]
MKKVLLGAASAALLALPGISFAATYAYVNQSGEVMTVDAATANAALMTAPGIGIHSGVMLMDDSSDQEVVGDKVPGA